MIAPAVLAAAAAVMAGLGADGSPQPAARATANGVTVDVDRHRGTTVTVSASRRIVMRGGEARITCAYRSDLYPRVQRDRVEVDWPAGRTSVRVRRLRRGYQYCALGVRYDARLFRPLAEVPLTATGRTWLADGHAASRALANLQKILLGGDTPPPAAALPDKGYEVLATPDAAPQPGAVGAYVDPAEQRVRVVVLSTTGSRVYVEQSGTEFRTNVPQWVLEAGQP
jgi:hypothetical protein